jgi:hypothetical protein
VPASGIEAADYPFTTSDLEFRGDSLHEALDLRATVLRIERSLYPEATR